MKDLSLEELCVGMLAIRSNAFELLNDARLLRSSGRTSRAYALAYFSCEEVGKLPILHGAATKLAVGAPIDWKQTAKRVRSHNSKAMHFGGIAKAVPMILEAVASGEKAIDGDELMQKAVAGMLLGPALFESRNVAIYCDFVNGKFVVPAEQIDERVADTMIQLADTNLAAANGLLNKSVEELAARFRALSRDQYEERQADALRQAEELFASFALREQP